MHLSDSKEHVLNIYPITKPTAVAQHHIVPVTKRNGLVKIQILALYPWAIASTLLS
jgi:hypothetical protein